MNRFLCTILTIGTTMAMFGTAIAGVEPTQPGNFNHVSIPEPTTLLILGAGAGTIIGVRAIRKIIKK